MKKLKHMWGVRSLTPSILLKQVSFGALSGAIFGIGFAFIAWLTEPGPELIFGIKQTWWFFAALGSIAQPIAYKYDSYEGLRHLMRLYKTRS